MVNFWKYHHGEQILYYAIKQTSKSLSEKVWAKKNIGSTHQHHVFYILMMCLIVQRLESKPAFSEPWKSPSNTYQWFIETIMKTLSRIYITL